MNQYKLVNILVIYIFIIACFLPILQSVPPTQAIGNEIYVDDNFYYNRDGTAEHPYETIQNAINQANEGDTIYVFGGTYNETLSISKPLTIIGSVEDGETSVYYKAKHKHTITISADYVTIEALNISGGTGNKNTHSLVYLQADDTVVQRCTISNASTWSIYLDTSNGNTIGNNHIADSRGVLLDSAENNVFSTNTFINLNEAGIKLIRSSTNNIFYGNFFQNCRYGIFSEASTYTNCTNNEILNSELGGIYLKDESNSVIQNNKIGQNGNNGIYCNSPTSFIRHNLLEGNQIGLTLISSYCNVYNNTLKESNLYGIQNVGNSNFFYINRFIRNNIQVKEEGNGQWYYEEKGNYWKDYTYIDRNGDGIGDMPYNIGSGKQDLYPLGYFLKGPEKPSDPSPDDGEDDVGLSVEFEVYIDDPDSDTVSVSFYKAVDDSLIGTNTKVIPGSFTTYDLTLPFETTFAWYVTVNDTLQENRSDIWFFTTKQRPPENEKPVADPGGPYTAGLNQNITFDGTDSYDPDGSIDFYRWNFGDGSSEILATTPTHAYDEVGAYQVTLTVVDSDGTSDIETTTVTISTVGPNLDPVAVISGATTVEEGKPLELDGSFSYDPDGSIQSYSWSFGDGETGSGASVTHTYSKAGETLITLTITDNRGATNQTTTSVTITPAPFLGIPGYTILLVLIALCVFVFMYKKH